MDISLVKTVLKYFSDSFPPIHVGKNNFVNCSTEQMGLLRLYAFVKDENSQNRFVYYFLKCGFCYGLFMIAMLTTKKKAVNTLMANLLLMVTYCTPISEVTLKRREMNKTVYLRHRTKTPFNSCWNGFVISPSVVFSYYTRFIATPRKLKN